MNEIPSYRFAPLIERRMEVILRLTAAEFRDSIQSFLDEAKAILPFKKQKAVDHWLFHLDGHKGRVPMPKALLYQGLELTTHDTSLILSAMPPTVAEQAKILFVQRKTQSDNILPFSIAMGNMIKMIELFDKLGGVETISQANLYYSNQIDNLKNPTFLNDGKVMISNILQHFNAFNQKTLQPPWNTSFHWQMSEEKKSFSHMSITHDHEPKLIAEFSYTSNPDSKWQDSKEVQQEFQLAHQEITEMFHLQFTPNALCYFKNGSLLESQNEAN